jgi:hypothetical protein
MVLVMASDLKPETASRTAPTIAQLIDFIFPPELVDFALAFTHARILSDLQRNRQPFGNFLAIVAKSSDPWDHEPRQSSAVSSHRRTNHPLLGERQGEGDLN